MNYEIKQNQDELNKANEDSQNVISEKDKQIIDLQRKIEQLENENIQNLSDDLKSKDDILTSQQNKINELTDQLSQYETLAKENETEKNN